MGFTYYEYEERVGGNVKAVFSAEYYNILILKKKKKKNKWIY